MLQSQLSLWNVYIHTYFSSLKTEYSTIFEIENTIHFILITNKLYADICQRTNMLWKTCNKPVLIGLQEEGGHMQHMFCICNVLHSSISNILIVRNWSFHSSLYLSIAWCFYIHTCQRIFFNWCTRFRISGTAGRTGGVFHAHVTVFFIALKQKTCVIATSKTALLISVQTNLLRLQAESISQINFVTGVLGQW